MRLHIHIPSAHREYAIMYDELMDDFADWLSAQLKEHSWSMMDFSKRSGISHSQISRVMAGLRPPGDLFLEKTAEALHIPLVDVYRIAGRLPMESPREDPRYLYVAKIAEVAGQLVKDSDLKELLYLAEMKLENQEEEEGK